MEHGMLWVEYSEWMQFYALEPWGSEVEDDRMAKLINYIVACNATEDHEWIPTNKIFPRSQADIDALVKKDEPAPELDVGTRLRAMLADRRERQAAQNSDPA